MMSIFVIALEYVYSKKAVYQQYVNCMINIQIFTHLDMVLNSVTKLFYAINGIEGKPLVFI